MKRRACLGREAWSIPKILAVGLDGLDEELAVLEKLEGTEKV